MRIGVAAALGGLGLSLGPGVAQAAGSTGWRVAYRSHSARPDPLQSVTAPSKNDAWAVGAAGEAGADGPLVLDAVRAQDPVAARQLARKHIFEYYAPYLDESEVGRLTVLLEGSAESAGLV